MNPTMTSVLDNDLLIRPWSQLQLLIGPLVLISLALFYLPIPKSSIPIINPRGRFDISLSKVKLDFTKNAKSLIKAGYAKYDVFWLTSDSGPKLILSQKYLNEIRSHPSLSFIPFMQAENHSQVRGFEPFGQDTLNSDIFVEVIRKKLTQAQGRVTGPLFDEASVALQQIWTDDSNWHEIALSPSIQRLVGQLSCKIFLGDELCRNEGWLRILTNYTGNSVRATQELRLWPKPTRQIVALFLQSTRILSREVQGARDILKPIIEKRRKDMQTALNEGTTPTGIDNALQWSEELANGRSYDPAMMQLALASVAIMTSADFLTQALFDLCGREALIVELRDEVVTVLRENGANKTSMYKLHLMDSFLKESQRMKPITLSTFRRMATDNIVLDDGTEIAKGTMLMITNDSMWDSKFYENPDIFDPYRFVKLRQVSGRESSAPLISVSPEHMGFGFGKHACPGRFFAVNEVKIALCHILLKYEFKVADGGIPRIRRHGILLQADTSAKVAVRRRQEEISMQDLRD